MDAKKAPLKLYKSLYSNETQDLSIKPRQKKKKPITQIWASEGQEQQLFKVWFEKKYPFTKYRWFHPPNGGSRKGKVINGKFVPLEGLKFQRMGVFKGLPDIICPMPRKSYHGLVIELKARNKTMRDVTREQKDWLAWFKTQGWSDHVAFGFDEAKEIVEYYLNDCSS